MYVYDQARQQDLLLIDEIARAINGEYSAIACYKYLAKIAPSKKDRRIIKEIRNDEMKHFETFSRIYTWLTNKQPSPKIIEECPKKYLDGLQFAIEDEQKTVDFYLDIADKAQNLYIKEQFRRAAADEQNHAVWFLYLYVQRKMSM
ncbi:ferritin-like domain-containing protein [Bacillus chungangensis]|uniref:Rubrerythrin n=1 Tax=Bacillus chungangensis TaxID=587633 RepID=A0ABT9WYI3_9BACI|nr:ferritin-like domain-containing protein [Bacillus chungangensis]MDQ0178304.1 rubrerythrin [Bacillus chungangensis]